jgi:hypothetical protein
MFANDGELHGKKEQLGRGVSFSDSFKVKGLTNPPQDSSRLSIKSSEQTFTLRNKSHK